MIPSPCSSSCSARIFHCFIHLLEQSSIFFLYSPFMPTALTAAIANIRSRVTHRFFLLVILLTPCHKLLTLLSAEIENQAEKKTATLDTIIDIPDPELKKAIQKALGIENRDITVADALSLESLECSNKGGAYINDLTGISAFTNLKELVIYISKITDISPLNSLTSLTHLELLNSPVTDITPLANLTNLTNLELGCCQITDISPLANLPNLIVLHIIGNPVVENLTREEMLDVLSGAENLQYLDYGAKPTERVSPMISSLLLTTGTLDVYHLLIS